MAASSANLYLARSDGEPVAAVQMAASETTPSATSPNAGVASAPAFQPASSTPEPLREPWLSALLRRGLPPVAGLAVMFLIWALIAHHSAYLPGPGKTFHSAMEVFSHPFYRKGPNDQGIAWNLLKSLGRVGEGFGLAALVGIPLGFILGRFAVLNRAAQPIISLLRPVSPLAWLPIGLAVFQKADPAAIFVIFICSIWPMIINTALGVASVPQDYLNVARVLNLSEWKVFTRILAPACVPYVLTGAKLALGIAWLAIVASEMLTGGVGIGFWLWDEWNNLNMEHILIAIAVIGSVGLLLEHGMTAVANRFDYRQK